MSAQLGELVISMQLEMARFREDMAKANRTTNDTMSRMAGDVNRGVGNMERSFHAFGSTVGVALSVGTVIAFTREVTNAALAAEKLQMQFKASTGSNVAAARELDYVRKLSTDLGLSFQSTATAYSKFLASTRNTSIEGAEARKVFEGVSTAVTALGLSTDEANGIFLALSQMMSKGKVSAEELNGQLGERLPGAAKMAADALGVTTAELFKMMQEGKVMSSDLLPKLAEQLHKTYGTAAEEAAKKGQAGINRFNNEVQLTAAAIGNKLLPVVNHALEGFAELAKAAREGINWNPKDWTPGNLLGPMSNGQSFSDIFTLPTAGQAAGFRQRNQTASERRAAFDSTLDPQAARAAYEARQTQDRINASRAAAEKLAAGAADRDKAAKKALADETRKQLEAQKAINAGLREQNQLLEAAVKDWDLSGLGSGLLDNPMSAPKPKNPKFSLTGASETMGYGGNNPISYPGAKEIEDARKQKEELLAIEQSYNDEILSMKFDAANQAAGLMRQMAGDSKAFAIAALIAQKGLAIAQIMINTEVAASSALLPPPVGLGPIAGMGLAASIRSMGYVSMGLAAASGAVEAAQIDGARASGGPVGAGQTYLVGEKGPELFTAGASGQITSNDKLQRLNGGKGVELTQVFQISPGIQGTVQAEIMRAVPALQRMAVQGVKQAMRGGEFQGV